MNMNNSHLKYQDLSKHEYCFESLFPVAVQYLNCRMIDFNSFDEVEKLCDNEAQGTTKKETNT